jgi:hypothetical protein
VAQLTDTREQTPTLRPDLSVREILAAVAAGQVAGGCEERGGDWINLWSGPDGVKVTPWDKTGRRLDFLLHRDIVMTRTHGNAELTTLGWQRFAQLVRPLTAEETERQAQAFHPLDPWSVMRWQHRGTPKFARCFRIGRPREPRFARRRIS